MRGWLGEIFAVSTYQCKRLPVQKRTKADGVCQGDGKIFQSGTESYNFFPLSGEGRRGNIVKKGSKLPNREQILKRMWQLANAGAGDAVRLACLPQEEWGGLDGLDLDALAEFKRGSNGVIELKFADRARLLERLLDAVDHSGEEQVDRFLQAMEEQGGK